MGIAKTVVVVLILVWIGADLAELYAIKGKKEQFDKYIEREIKSVKKESKVLVRGLINSFEYYTYLKQNRAHLLEGYLDLENEHPEDVDFLWVKYSKINEMSNHVDYSGGNGFKFDKTGQTEALEQEINFRTIANTGLDKATGHTASCMNFGYEVIKSVVDDSIYLVQFPCFIPEQKTAHVSSVNGVKADWYSVNFNCTIKKTNVLDVEYTLLDMMRNWPELDTIVKHKTIHLKSMPFSVRK